MTASSRLLRRVTYSEAAVALEFLKSSRLHIWIVLRTRFPTVPSSRTVLLMIIARVGRLHRSRPFCRTNQCRRSVLSKRDATGLVRAPSSCPRRGLTHRPDDRAAQSVCDRRLA